MEEENKEPEQEKTFTQAELDAIIGKRLADERKKYPTQEQMAAYNAWKDAQQTEAEKLTAMTDERNAAQKSLAEAQNEVQHLKHERYLLDKGVTADDIDYYDYKISKAVTEDVTYEQAADAFLRERPAQVRVDMSPSLSGGRTNASTSGMMNDLIRKAARK